MGNTERRQAVFSGFATAFAPVYTRDIPALIRLGEDRFFIVWDTRKVDGAVQVARRF